jgi:hypothetical protein
MPAGIVSAFVERIIDTLVAARSRDSPILSRLRLLVSADWRIRLRDFSTTARRARAAMITSVKSRLATGEAKNPHFWGKPLANSEIGRTLGDADPGNLGPTQECPRQHLQASRHRIGHRGKTAPAPPHSTAQINK